QTGKDIWINIRASATDDYVRQLATLLHVRLNPALKIYIEHSNEVWNPLFGQNAYNLAATQAEIKKGGSALNRDGADDLNTPDALHAVAQGFGLKHVVYEGGPDNGGGSTTNVGSRILANRDPGMRDLIEHDVRDNWFGRGGDLYMYFALSGAYSRYGCWGLAEDIMSLNTVKFQAVQDMVGPPPTPIINPGAVL